MTRLYVTNVGNSNTILAVRLELGIVSSTLYNTQNVVTSYNLRPSQLNKHIDTRVRPTLHYIQTSKLLNQRTLNFTIDLLQCTGNYSATSNNMKLVYTGRWWVGCYIWHSEEGTERGRGSPSPLLAVPNVTAYTPTASVRIIVLLYNGPLFCGYNVPIEGLTWQESGSALQAANVDNIPGESKWVGQ